MVRWHKQTSHIVFDHFQNSADTPRNARTCKTHRFKNTQAKAFCFRREQTNVGGLKIVFNVVDLLTDNHPILKPQPPHVVSERRETITSKDDEFEGIARTDASDRFEQQINSLQRAQIGGMENQHFVLHAQFATHFFTRAARLTLSLIHISEPTRLGMIS